ncbi:serine hydrolase domain-containing protein [Pseudoxanthomonas wuyuanensis]|uniref:CubicO group peptidase, beta-lactamase class C family n=1 Tax=Pseudoxanthomonas wuyuanensis TaxID=1073196 RepID=A0A286D6L8_9GAMM|nr:serine hydrolase domain-containing protein [Pseudoxanthomonas wuyuanensis]KAF1721474.1 serine hydrolase [Pseudoxanthomonas wuyuanensis]SOD54267.1 CubicO group peptidase, beta-lactamase class C family [Pseudoxanthomonas wuyuanensis]
MQRLRPLLLAVALALAVPRANAVAAEGAAAASPAQAGVSAQRLQRLDEFLRKATDQDGYLGGVSLVMRDGRLAGLRAYGHRDLARSQPMRVDTIFRLYSMTKPITSVAVLQLMERGLLGLDDPVSHYLPEFADMQLFIGGTADAPQLREANSPITIRQLLTHTGGFATGGEGYEQPTRLLQRADLHGSATLEEFSQRLGQVPLAAEPGSRFKYDGTGIEVLARLVEVVSGESFEAYLQRHILQPLGMRDTGFSVPQRERHRIADITVMGADGRLRLDDGPSAREPGARLNPYPSGAGGLYSTASDYARFCQMLLDGGRREDTRLLSRKTVELMMMNHLTQLDPPVTEFSDAEGFGLGGYVVLDVAGRGRPGSVGAFGWSGAASTTFTIDRQEKLVAILLLQHLPDDSDRDLPRVGTRFYTLVYQALEP